MTDRTNLASRMARVACRAPMSRRAPTSARRTAERWPGRLPLASRNAG